MPVLTELAWLAAIVLFVLGLRGMTRRQTAVRGNLLAAIGMGIAIVATLVSQTGFGVTVVAAAILVGAGIGVYVAQVTKPERMPETIALLSGLSGSASLLAAGASLARAFVKVPVTTGHPSRINVDTEIVFSLPTSSALAMALCGIIGGVTLAAGVVAAAKLAGVKEVAALQALPQQSLINIGIGGFLALLTVTLLALPSQPTYWFLVIVSTVLGYFLVVGIDADDMPPVVPLLIAYSGFAAAAAGFIINNTVVVIAGSLVGASGLVLTKATCRAMNRPWTSLLLGTLPPPDGGRVTGKTGGTVKTTSAEDVAMLLELARRVVIVPGYGMALAQAQHPVRDLTNLLKSRGCEVLFGIHPLAGRMPGHMNALLADVDLPYDLMQDVDEVNTSLDQADVCLVIGANDTVNPDGRTNPKSHLAGMPIINADRARTCIIVKRSVTRVTNPLFTEPNSLVLQADAKQGLADIVNVLKQR